MISKTRVTQGFTLIELLIASSVFMVILIIVSQSLGSAGLMANRYVNRTELLEDTRTAGQLVEDEVAKATYVYPPGVNVNLGNGYTVTGPGMTSGDWTVGNQMLAFIQSPRDLNVACDRTVIPDPLVVTTTANRDGCLLFIAYYPVLRSNVVGSATGGARPPASSPNGAQWTLFEYRRWLPGKRLIGFKVGGVNEAITPNVTVYVPTDVSGASGSMLADFINPADGFGVSYGSATDTWCRVYTGGTPIILPCSSPQVLTAAREAGTTVLRGAFGIHAVIKGGAAVDLAPIGFSVAPRNL
jgi:prepilin-type N-terminal cleavage/methylation domain-containing protein